MSYKSIFKGQEIDEILSSAGQPFFVALDHKPTASDLTFINDVGGVIPTSFPAR